MKTVGLREMAEGVWAHVERCKPPLTPLMAFVKGLVLDACAAMDAEPNKFRLVDREAIDRIGKYARLYTGKGAYVTIRTGEWTVTNRDLEVWADVGLFAGREEKSWGHWFGKITEAIHDKRRTQALERFEATGVTTDHRKLAAKLGWDLSLWRGDGVSLYVQGKRPFGNSSIDIDIADAVGWKWCDEDDEDPEFPDELGEKCWDLFDELQFAVPAILREPAPCQP